MAGKRLPQEKVERILMLDMQGIARREISRRLYVARGTVDSILSGSYISEEEYEQRKVAKKLKQERQRLSRTGKIIRCPKCRNLVRSPCLACQVEASNERRRDLGPELQRLMESGGVQPAP